MEHMRIGQILSELVPLSDHDIEEILHEQSRNGRRFGQIALAWGLCRAEDVWEAWCRQLGEAGLQWVDLEELGIDARATAQLSRELAVKYRVIPMRCSEAMLLAVDEPVVQRAMRELPGQCPRPLKFVLASSGEIQDAIRRYYGA
jgi:hypothetical protein